MLEENFQYQTAIQDFRRARRRASLEQIMSFVKGKSADLFSYEEVRKHLKINGYKARRLEEIPLDSIVGSVGRYADFTRSFLPRRDSDEQRWARVQSMMQGMSGLPPIDVFQIDNVYFVADGNHRVSVARQFGATHIEAYVTEIQTAIPVTPDLQLDDLIIKAEYAEFLSHTQLDELRPEADLTVTVPGKYRLLEEHITVHHYFMGQEQQRDIPYTEAVTHWYDEVYLPLAMLIREQGLLRDFPDRTVTDLYLWIKEYREELEKRLGWAIPHEAAAQELATKLSSTPGRLISRVSEKILEAVTPRELEAGPAPGHWRKEVLALRRRDRLFSNVLVPISGKQSEWTALEQALELARREDGNVFGLHVIPSEAQRDSKMVYRIQQEFEQRCRDQGFEATCAVEVGDIASRICERTRWTDLLSLNLAHPPESTALAKLKSGFHTIVQRCPRPILAVPCAPTPMRCALLAYDGSPKADEALFISTYLAGRWNIKLVVVTVVEVGRISAEILSLAKDYLTKSGVTATFVQECGPVSEAILATAEHYHCDVVIMGGYGRNPLLEIVLGSKIDQILRSSQYPMLICR